MIPEGPVREEGGRLNGNFLCGVVEGEHRLSPNIYALMVVPHVV